MYYIEKMGVYSHGIFWIGEDIDVGKQKCLELAFMDYDSYHVWELKEYDSNILPDARYDSTFKVVFACDKERVFNSL